MFGFGLTEILILLAVGFVAVAVPTAAALVLGIVLTLRDEHRRNREGDGP
jgi:hypothetical protein